MPEKTRQVVTVEGDTIVLRVRKVEMAVLALVILGPQFYMAGDWADFSEVQSGGLTITGLAGLLLRDRVAGLGAKAAAAARAFLKA